MRGPTAANGGQRGRRADQPADQEGADPVSAQVVVHDSMLVLGRELPDAHRRAGERRALEEERDRVRNVVERRPVELVGSGGGVQRVADGDLVSDDEHTSSPTLAETPERIRVTTGGGVETLSARIGALAAELAFRRPVPRQR